MKKLIIAILLLASPLMAQEPIQLARMNAYIAGSGGGAAATPCSTTTDYIGIKTTVYDAGVIGAATIECSVSTVTCVSGCTSGNLSAAYVSHDGTDAHTMKVRVFTCPPGDTCNGTAEPSANIVAVGTSAQIASNANTGAFAEWPTWAITGAVTVSGTYWVCGVSNNAWRFHHSTTGTLYSRGCDATCYTTDSSSGSSSWTQVTTNKKAIAVTIGP